METVSTAVCLSSTERVIDIDITRALFAVTQRLLWRELVARFGFCMRDRTRGDRRALSSGASRSQRDVRRVFRNWRQWSTTT